MFGEIFKVLADEPEKIEKVILKSIKIILSILIATSLYKKVIGPFYLIPLSDYGELINFILSGRVLICLLFYFISEHVIIPWINVIAYVPVYLVSKVKARLERKDLRLILQLAGIIKFKKGNEIPVPGKNISILYDFSLLFFEDDTKSEVNNLKNSVIANIWNIYFAFSIIYFLKLNANFHKSALTEIVLCGLLLILATYWIIHVFFDYMLKNYQQIINGLSFIKIDNLINSILMVHSIYPIRGKDGLGKYKTFDLNNKEYVLVVPKFYGWKISDIDLQQLLTKREKPGRIFIVIVNSGDYIGDAFTLSFENHDNLIMIDYIDEKNLEVRLKQVMTDIIKAPR